MKRKSIGSRIGCFLRRTEFKKIGFVMILVYSVAYITFGRICETRGIYVDTSTDVALIYTVCGAFVSYCLASATDKLSMNRTNLFIGEKTDGTE